MLQQSGASITIGHGDDLPEGLDLVVYSSAIKPDNPELKSARSQGIKCLRRADFLAELMRPSRSVTICGTHGKTTTTGLTISALSGCALDPSFAVGGLHRSLNKYSNFGRGEIFVAEADESDASFLAMPAEVAVITNIDYDHMETYAGDFRKLKAAFLQFVQQVSAAGCAVVCWDDPAVRDIMQDYNGKMLRYGEHADADVRLIAFKQTGMQSSFKFAVAGKEYSATIAVPGLHNAINSLAAIAIAHYFALPMQQVITGLASFSGMGRRFHVHGEMQLDNKRALLLEDYAHHPRALEATLLAARNAWPKRRILLVVQLHRYTRVAALFNEFVTAICLADEVLLPPIYAASEDAITGINSTAVATAVTALGVACHAIDALADVTGALPQVVCDDDIVIFVGAGSINQLLPELVN